MNTKRSAIVLMLSLAAFASAAAIWVALTRQEFVQAVTEGSGDTAMETIHGGRPLRQACCRKK